MAVIGRISYSIEGELLERIIVVVQAALKRHASGPWVGARISIAIVQWAAAAPLQQLEVIAIHSNNPCCACQCGAAVAAAAAAMGKLSDSCCCRVGR